MPLIYIPKSLASTAPSKIIDTIHFCAYAPEGISGPADPGSSSSNVKMTNHWVIYFVISPSQWIRFDPSPTGQNNSLELIVTSGGSSLTETAVKNVRLTPATGRGLTIGQVIDQITNSKYDKYQFSPGGQGCRYWLHYVATLLGSVGYLPDGAEVEAATRALQFVWGNEGEPVAEGQQMGITEGTFY